MSPSPGNRFAPPLLGLEVANVTAGDTDTALRDARYIGTSERFSMNLQIRFDLEVEKTRPKKWLVNEVAVLKNAT